MDNKNHITFKSLIAEQFKKNTYPKIALLISNEYEGFSSNGGIGSYYTSLSQNLALTDWNVILIICRSEQKYAGKSSVKALKHVFSMGEIEEVLDLNPEHQLILNAAKQNSFVNYPDVNYQSIASWFYTQAFTHTFPDSQIYVEFPDTNGFGYHTIQAKKSNLLGENCLTAITLHGCFEWLLEASDTICREEWLDRFCHREQFSYENVDLAFFPSYFLKQKIESFGWQTKHTIHLPYFVPIQPVFTPQKIEGNSKNNQNKKYIPVVFFGRLQERKGLCTFVQALKGLNPELQAQIKLIFLGNIVPLYCEGTTDLDSEKYIKRELESQFNYEIISDFFSEQAIKYICDLDSAIVCLTSPQDNFPNTALEMGQLPVTLVVSDTGGFRETLDLVKRKEGLYWFKPRDVDSLQEKLEEALKDYPQTPKVAEKSILENLNKELLVKKVGYLERAFAKIKPREKPTKKVTIGIISVNQGEYLLDCLNSIKAQSYQFLEVIVIDNNSSEQNSKDLFMQMESFFPDFKFISLEKRQGIGAIKNHFLEISDGEYFLSFNPQVRLFPSAIEKLMETAINCKAGVVTSVKKQIGENEGVISHPDGGVLTMMIEENVYGGECCLFSRELLNKFPYTEDKDINSQNREIITASVVTKQTIIYYPYPLYEYVVSHRESHTKQQLSREKFSLRQYLANIPPHEWSPRQIYMLLTVVQQFEIVLAQMYKIECQGNESQSKLIETTTKLHQAETYIHQIENQLQSAKDRIAAMESSKFWNLRQKWFKLKRYLGLSVDE